MTRQRDIPSVQYRSPNVVNMLLPERPGSAKVRVLGAARLNDAYGAVSGTTGFGTIVMFETPTGSTYTSTSIRKRGAYGPADTNRGQTRMIFDPDDFTTPVDPAASYLPSDDNVLFLRVETYNNAAGIYSPQGPILIVPPYDFWTTKGPVVTVTGMCPNLDIGVFPPNLPDTLGPGLLNFLLPGYLSTVSISNLDATHPLFFSFHPGLPPSVLKPGQDMTLTGGGSPELFLAAPNGNPWFTLRASAINSA